MPQPKLENEYKEANKKAVKAILDGGLTAPNKGGLIRIWNECFNKFNQ